MKNSNHYPAPTGAYKVKVKNNKNWPYKNARIQMSLRNDKYEDQKLYALLEWVSHRFENIELIVSDSLVRHNLIFELGLSETDALRESILLGDKWLKKYSPLLDTFGIKVSRWDKWLNHENFQESYQSILMQFHTNARLKTAVKNTIDRFWMRQGHYQNKPYELYAPCGTNYMLEELAVFNCMFPDKAADIYAGQWCGECVEAIRESILDEMLRPYLDCYYVEVDMSRNNGYLSDKTAA
jgi:tRNA-dependent cyclodipeptide synthase